MNQSAYLSKVSSSQMIGWGLALTGIGAVVFALAFPASLQPYAGGESVFFTVVAGLASLVGWIMMAVGITRLAAKADDIHRIFVEKHIKAVPVTSHATNVAGHATTVTKQDAASTVDRFLKGSEPAS